MTILKPSSEAAVPPGVERLIFEAAWENERLVNYFRAGLSLAIGISSSLGVVFTNRPYIWTMGMILGYGCLSLMAVPLLRRKYFYVLSHALSFADITVFTLALYNVSLKTAAADPVISVAALHAIWGQALFLSAINMIRFSWPVAVWSTAYAYLLCASLVSHVEGFGIGLVFPVFNFLALAALLKISASRFRRVLLRLKERETLSRFLPAPALERVEKDPTSLEMGGEEQMATILFADIRGFTAISSHLTPKQIVGMLNEYFEEMVDEIFAWEGVMDKFIGDGICAVFVPPLAPRQQALNALQCALGMRRRLAALNARREDRGEAPLEIGIGIHSGALLAGYIGSSKRMEYTHIGDSVNVASRIEGLTKDLGAPILASQASATLCGRSAIFRLRPLRRAKVKGKLRALKVYAVEEVKAKVKQTYGPTRRFHKNLENMD